MAQSSCKVSVFARTSYLHTSPKKQRQIEAALPRNCNRHHGTCTGQDCGVSKDKAFKSDDVGLIQNRYEYGMGMTL